MGSALCRRLIHVSNWTVLNIDALTYASSLESLNEVATSPKYSFVKGDVCNGPLLDQIFLEFAPDVVFHLAAESAVDRSIQASAEFVRTNIVGTHTILESARFYWERIKDSAHRDRFRFLHVSTDEVFGSLGETGSFNETTAYDPHSPYAASKASSDHLVKAWHHTYGLPVLISNCSNNYGAYQFPEKLIPFMIVKALAGEPLPVYGDGCNVRDWIYVDDHTEALECIVSKGRVGETYNVGGRSERRNVDVVNAIINLIDELAPDRTAPRSELQHVADRPGHDKRYAVDCTKIETELGWRSRVTFESGIRNTVQWYISRRDWWEPIIERGRAAR